MKKIIFIIILSFIHFSSFSQSEKPKNTIDSSSIKLAIADCLTTAPKNMNKTLSREFVKKCLVKKGIEIKKNNSLLVDNPLDQNQALK